MKKITLLLAGIVSCLPLCAAAESQVTVHYPGQSEVAIVSHAANLSQLVASPAFAGKTWWPGTVIAERLATAAAQQQYQQLMARLKAYRDDSDGDKAAAINNVIQQLSAVKVTGRQFVNLDPDWVRVRPVENRRLEGEYDVYTLAKPNSVTLFGAISGSGKVSWQPGVETRDYFDGHERLAGAERNIALVIAPSGEVREVPIAYWNHRHVEVEPGSTIYLGFSSWSLPGAYEDLNQQIISVLTHRIPD
ncbi:capsule biosynthesis GfcC D2 domain-containing protein [Pantoea sp. B65]|uniref:capsule biosynthesis GfcC D2 domain-containing protein n=1 Tax=Pantoea sp. B65 TaxID=2813359 RepID=UPI0039B6724F